MKPWQRKGCNQFGAQMGRRSDSLALFTGRVRLARVPIDNGGYDPGGAYWGTGLPLYCAWDDEGNEAYTRATSRLDAASKFALSQEASWYRPR